MIHKQMFKVNWPQMSTAVTFKNLNIPVLGAWTEDQYEYYL
jgi:hypothetical protein